MTDNEILTTPEEKPEKFVPHLIDQGTRFTDQRGDEWMVTDERTSYDQANRDPKSTAVIYLVRVNALPQPVDAVVFSNVLKALEEQERLGRTRPFMSLEDRAHGITVALGYGLPREEDQRKALETALPGCVKDMGNGVICGKEECAAVHQVVDGHDFQSTQEETGTEWSDDDVCVYPVLGEVCGSTRSGYIHSKAAKMNGYEHAHGFRPQEKQS